MTTHVSRDSIIRDLTQHALEVGSLLNLIEDDDEREVAHERFDAVLDERLHDGVLDRRAGRAVGDAMLAAVIGDGFSLKVRSRDEWPVHQPECHDAPIPGRQWYRGCEPGGDFDPETRSYTGTGPRVNPSTGVCAGCGASACPKCGRENCPQHAGVEAAV